MKLQFIRDGSPSNGPCWRGKRDGEEIVCVRVICGLSLPQGLEAPKGCAVLLAERYDQEKPPAFEVLGARVADWRGLERTLVGFRRLAQMGGVITEDERAVEIVRRLRGLREAAPRVPCPIFPAPPEALAEIGRQQVNELIREGRLHLGPVEATLNESPEAAARAIACAVVHCLRRPSRPGPRPEVSAASKKRARSYSGRPLGPDESVPVPPMLGLRVEGQVLMSADGRHNFGTVGHGGPVRPGLRAQNRRRARSWLIRFRD